MSDIEVEKLGSVETALAKELIESSGLMTKGKRGKHKLLDGRRFGSVQLLFLK